MYLFKCPLKGLALDFFGSDTANEGSRSVRLPERYCLIPIQPGSFLIPEDRLCVGRVVTRGAARGSCIPKKSEALIFLCLLSLYQDKESKNKYIPYISLVRLPGHRRRTEDGRLKTEDCKIVPTLRSGSSLRYDMIARSHDLLNFECFNRNGRLSAC